MTTITEASEWDFLSEPQRTAWLKDRVREVQAKTIDQDGRLKAAETNLNEALRAIERLEAEVERLKRPS